MKNDEILLQFKNGVIEVLHLKKNLFYVFITLSSSFVATLAILLPMLAAAYFSFLKMQFRRK